MKFFHLAAMLFLCVLSAGAQKVAVKTNLLYDALLNVNGGVEVGLAPRWTLDVSGNLNAWTLSHDRRWKHWLVQPEARYWFCDRFAGHFMAAQVHGGQYNVGHLKNSISFLGSPLKNLSDQRFQGWFAGAGIGYGYDWILNRHWNIEAEIAIGWAYTRYDVYNCAGCGKKVASGRHHNYFGPTKAAINIVYLF